MKKENVSRHDDDPWAVDIGSAERSREADTTEGLADWAGDLGNFNEPQRGKKRTARGGHGNREKRPV